MLKSADNVLNGHSSMFRPRMKKCNRELEAFESLSLIKQPPPKKHNMQTRKLNQLTLVSALPLNQFFWHQNQTLWEMDTKQFPLGILFG